jgi:hypothetical protein
MRRFDHFISLGRTCGTKYQIALNGFRRDRPSGSLADFDRHLHSRAATATQVRGRSSHFFDWFVTPFPSAVRLIATGFAHVCERRNLVITGNGNVVHDRGCDVYYYHEFQRSGAVLTERELDAQYAQQRAKLMHYRQKFQKLLRSDARVLYVVGLPVKHRLDVLEKFHEAMAAQHPRHRYVLLCVRHSSAQRVRRRPLLLHSGRRQIVWDVTSDIDKPPADQWSFNDGPWQEVLDGYGWNR